MWDFKKKMKGTTKKILTCNLWKRFRMIVYKNTTVYRQTVATALSDKSSLRKHTHTSRRGSWHLIKFLWTFRCIVGLKLQVRTRRDLITLSRGCTYTTSSFIHLPSKDTCQIYLSLQQITKRELKFCFIIKYFNNLNE